MTSPISTVTIPLPSPDLREIRRYAACPQGAETELAAALSELSDLQGRVSYRTFSVRQDGDLLDLGFAAVCSHDLCRALQGAEHVLLFAATLGIRPDRLLARYSRLSPAKAVLLQAICTERIEALLDRFCQMQQEALAQQNAVLLPRFSPGYGDLPLELQREIFAALDCPRQLGITLNDSLLMTPSKSVTALAGIKGGTNL